MNLGIRSSTLGHCNLNYAQSSISVAQFLEVSMDKGLFLGYSVECNSPVGYAVCCITTVVGMDSTSEVLAQISLDEPTIWAARAEVRGLSLSIYYY
jgi:hypothetical protein